MTAETSMADIAESVLEFADWYETAHPRVVAALIAFGASREDAEDATNEAFARALVRWDRVGAGVSPTGWTFVVARNLVRRTARRRIMELTRMERLLPRDSRRSGDPAEWAALAADLAAQLRELSPRQRTVLILHFGLDISEADLASLLRVTRSTVSSTITNARRQLLTNTRDSECRTSRSADGSAVVTNRFRKTRTEVS